MKKFRKLLSLLLVCVMTVTMFVSGGVTAGADDYAYTLTYMEVGKELLYGYDIESPVLILGGITNTEFVSYTTKVQKSDYYNTVYRVTVGTDSSAFTFESYYSEYTKSYGFRAYEFDGTPINGLLSNVRRADIRDKWQIIFVLNPSSAKNKGYIRQISETAQCQVSVGISDTNPTHDHTISNFYGLPENILINLKNEAGRSYPIDDEKSAKTEIKELTDLIIMDIPDQVYTGKSINPDILMMDGTYELVKNKDYRITYGVSKEIGTYSMRITGIGDYKGSITRSYMIVPASTSINVSKSGSKIKFSWKPVSNISKYEIYYSVNGGKYKKLTEIDGTKTTYSNKFKKGKTYRFMIRTYKTSNRVKYYSEYSKVVKIKF